MKTASSDAPGGLQELRELEAALRPIDIAGIHAGLREQVLSRYPPGLRIALMRRYLETATPERRVLLDQERRLALLHGRGVDSWAQANLDLAKFDRDLRASKVHLAFSESSIREMAETCANVCRFASRNRTPEAAYRAVAILAARHRLRIPRPGEAGKTLAGCVARLCDAKWWRRAIRSTYSRNAENVEREIGLVSKHRAIYASDDALQRRQEQRARNRNLLEELVAINDLGEFFTLAELSDLNVSNPALRRCELMTRIAGFERSAEQAGHKALMLSLTTPSRFHAVLAKSGQRNPAFDGSTVRDGHKYLNRQWARARAALARDRVAPYGFRIAEPHHDGTLHWHLIVFLPESQTAPLKAIMDRYFDPPEEMEPGSDQRRVNVVDIDPAKGSAAGYIAKYVSKNIDGHGVDIDHEADPSRADAKENVRRVDAWASTHGIRQFQQIGGPPVTVWREARRLHTSVTGPLEDVRRAADDGLWDDFCAAMGGIHCSRKSRPVQLHCVRSPRPGVYGEPIERQVRGVRCGSVIAITRARTWTFSRAARDCTPWTRVNNCTQEPMSTMECGSLSLIGPRAKNRTPAADQSGSVRAPISDWALSNAAVLDVQLHSGS